MTWVSTKERLPIFENLYDPIGVKDKVLILKRDNNGELVPELTDIVRVNQYNASYWLENIPVLEEPIEVVQQWVDWQEQQKSTSAVEQFRAVLEHTVIDPENKRFG